MQEKITYGIKNGHYAEATHTGEGSLFGAPKAWEGWSEMSLPPVGDPVKVFADDVVYFKMFVNQGYDGNLTAKRIPEDFKLNHLGEYKDTNGVMIEKSSSVSKDFALLGEFQTADENSANPKRFALYSCTAGRADLSGKTKENSVEIKDFQIPITASPTPADEIVKATILKSDNEAIFNSWFDSVYYNPAFVATQRVSITVNSAGQPVAGALVVLGEKIAKTDAMGKASFMMGAGSYDIIVSANGYTAKTDSATVAAAAVEKTITITGK